MSDSTPPSDPLVPPPGPEGATGGAETPSAPPPPAVPPPLPVTPPVHPYTVVVQAPGPDGLAVACLVLGILSCVTCCSPIFSVLFGIVGLILGLTSKTRGGIRKVGIILCIIAPSVVLLAVIAVVFGLVAIPFFMAGAGR